MLNGTLYIHHTFITYGASGRWYSIRFDQILIKLAEGLADQFPIFQLSNIVRRPFDNERSLIMIRN